MRLFKRRRKNKRVDQRAVIAGMSEEQLHELLTQLDTE